MADSSIPITAGSGTNIRALTGLGAGSAAQQVMSLGDPLGNLAPFDPDGTLQVANDPTNLFLDSFDNGSNSRWVTGTGTSGAIAQAVGQMTLTTATTASSLAWMYTAVPMPLQPNAYMRITTLVKLDTATITNSVRFWGYGVVTTPTAVAPGTDGIFFATNVSGGLEAITMNNSTKTVVAALTRPTDGAFHRYEIIFKQTVAYFSIDNVVVYTLPYANLRIVGGMNGVVGTVNATSAASATTSTAFGSMSITDTGRNNQTISDSVEPSVRATVRNSPLQANALAKTTDAALVVQAYQTAGLISVATSSAVSTVATVTLAAPGVGLRHYITGVWIQRYAAAALTAATTPVSTTASNTTLILFMDTTAQAAGSVNTVAAMAMPNPIPSASANTATSIGAAVYTNAWFKVIVQYFVAP